MYYTEQRSANSDFYNSYRNHYCGYNNDEEDYLTLILKVLVIIFLSGLLFFGYLFITNGSSIKKYSGLKFSQDIPLESGGLNNQINSIKKEIGSNSKLNLTQEDIANIIAIVMNKINKDKKDRIVSDDEYTKELLYQDLDKLDDNRELNIDIINSEKMIVKGDVSEKGINYYNKIVISGVKEDKHSNNRLSKLSMEIESAINNSSLEKDKDTKDTSDYEREIEKEVKVRSNEMRFIIVKKGDSLSKIAKRAYGSYDSYIKIFEANPEIIKNPNQIYEGEKLRIPL